VVITKDYLLTTQTGILLKGFTENNENPSKTYSWELDMITVGFSTRKLVGGVTVTWKIYFLRRLIIAFNRSRKKVFKTLRIFFHL
jgi:hypothetical protein